MVDLLVTTKVVYVIFDAELTLPNQTTSLCWDFSLLLRTIVFKGKESTSYYF